MVLNMSRPWKHPKTGVYWLRKRVPRDIATRVGRNLVTKTLGTRDPEEAKARFVAALAELEAEWANLRRGERPITDREAHLLSQRVHDAWLREFGDNPF